MASTPLKPASLLWRQGHTPRIGPHLTQAAPPDTDPGAVAAVGRLGPGVPGVEGEVDARGPDPGGERTSGVVTGVAGLKVDVVVGAGGQDVGMGLVDRHHRLVLLVLGERTRWAADRHPRVPAMGGGG